MIIEPSGYLEKRSINGIDQSIYFLRHTLEDLKLEAKPDPDQVATKSFYAGAAGYFGYDAISGSGVVNPKLTLGVPTSDGVDYQYYIITKGTNFDAQNSDYVEVVKLVPGLVFGINTWAMTETVSVDDPLTLDADGKWKLADTSGDVVIAKVVATAADGDDDLVIAEVVQVKSTI